MIASQLIDIDESLRIFSLPDLPSSKVLKDRYRKLIKRYHPDLNPENLLRSNQMMQILNRAYEVLRCRLSTPIDAKRLPKIAPVWHSIREGDLAIRDAVIMGCLGRTHKNILGHDFREKVRSHKNSLDSQEAAGLWIISFFQNLFQVFLKTTDERLVRPLPHVCNSTRFFKNLAIANRYLDLGIRTFYSYLYKGTLRYFYNIPLSFLQDSSRGYSFLRSQVWDEMNLKLLESRMALARLYQIRIHNPLLNA